MTYLKWLRQDSAAARRAFGDFIFSIEEKTKQKILGLSGLAISRTGLTRWLNVKKKRKG